LSEETDKTNRLSEEQRAYEGMGRRSAEEEKREAKRKIKHKKETLRAKYRTDKHTTI